MEITEIGLLLAKIEGTYGTDPTPTAASNAVATVGGRVTYEAMSTERARKILDGGLGRIPGDNALVHGKLTFTVEVRGNLRNGGTQLDISNGTSTQALEISALMRACNLSETYTAAGTPGSEGSAAGSRDGYVTYQPTIVTDEGPSVTLYFYTHKKLHTLTGGKGTFKISGGADDRCYLEFTFFGKYVAVSDVTFSSVIGSVAFTAIKPPLFSGASATLGAYSPVFSKFDIDLGNAVVPTQDINSSNGIKRFLVGARDTRGSFDPESVAEATNPFWSDWKAATVQTLTLPIGSASGNKCTITATIQLTSVNYSESNNQRIHTANFAVNRSAIGTALGAEFQLKFF